MAARIFDRFDGTWEVAVMKSNAPAQAFWRVVIASYTSHRYEEFSAHHGSTEFVVFRFHGDHRSQLPLQ